MIKVNVVAVGKVKEKYFQQGIEEYSKRLSRFCEFGICEVRECNLTDNPNEKERQRIIETEAAEISKKLRGSVYAMCVEGQPCSSERFSEILQKEADLGNEITFVIGGSYGLSQEIKDASKGKISFSQMTFPHTLFRLILTEQIYRGFTISAGSSYHK
ncbi:MAG: 23S rRNA (pseudouridine(1915)-N(3))-methyltransferase RlmH [Christensenellaceae bacterium]